jgi:hypothetical protein
MPLVKEFFIIHDCVIKILIYITYILMTDLTILTNINPLDRNKANIQLSYPEARIKGTPTEYSYTKLTMAPNFSASIFNTYINGSCNAIKICGKMHETGIEHDAELVLEHVSGTTTFYVVIPILFNASPTVLDKLIEPLASSEGIIIALNSLLQNDKSVFYYQSKSYNPVFVFKMPIFSSKPKPSSLANYSTIFNGIYSTKASKKAKPVYRGFLANALIIDEEIQCEYVTQTDANVEPANQQLVTDIFVWTSITLGLVLGLFYFLRIISKKPPDSANTIYTVVGGIGFLMLMIYISLFTNTTIKKVQYGAMTFLSLAAIVLSLMAYNQLLFEPQVKSS